MYEDFKTKRFETVEIMCKQKVSLYSSEQQQS